MTVRGIDAVRREMLAHITQIIDVCKKRQYKQIEKHFPCYTVELPEGSPGKQTRVLSVMDTRKHGKRRVYTDSSVLKGPRKHDLYLAYVSEKDLIKWYPRLKENPTVLNKLSNRWLLTFDRAASCRQGHLIGFLNTIVAIEKEAVKGNRPPDGWFGTSSSEKWVPGSLIGHGAVTSLDPSNPKKILCHIKRGFL